MFLLVHRTLKLTVEQKCDIATRELEELRDEQQRAKEDYERAWDNHKAIVDEAEIRTTEIKKSWYEFDRDIVKGALNQVSVVFYIYTRNSTHVYRHCRGVLVPM